MIRVVVSCLLLVVVLLIFSSCSTFKSEKQVEVITQEPSLSPTQKKKLLKEHTHREKHLQKNK